MNIAEILKNVPKGTKLYSPAFGEVTFKNVSSDIINVKDNAGMDRTLYSNGNYYKGGDWNTFIICPFKKGDFIVKEDLKGTKFIAIFSHFGGPCEYTTHYLCLLRPDGRLKPNADFGIGNIKEARLATDSEKKELLDVMARNGYCWDECSMTLKELILKFKVGDTIRKDHLKYKIVSIEGDRYSLENRFFLKFTDQHEWEVVKFDINSLKPFDRVLVRDIDGDYWKAAIFSHSNEYGRYKYICVSNTYNQCIPYNNDTEHLLGKRGPCPEYYKNW